MAERVTPANCPECNRPLPETGDGQCPECGHIQRTADPGRAAPSFLSLPQLRYPNAYAWLILVSALDLILTLLVVYEWEGYEVNPIAKAVIDGMGFVWAIVFKFGIVVLVVIICDVIGRRDDRSGRTLAIGAVIINAIPVAYSFALLIHAGPVAGE